MELLQQIEQKVKIIESRVQLNNGNIVVVKDYYDESDKIIDTSVRTKDGYEIDDPAEVDEILNFLDEMLQE